MTLWKMKSLCNKTHKDEKHSQHTRNNGDAQHAMCLLSLHTIRGTQDISHTPTVLKKNKTQYQQTDLRVRSQRVLYLLQTHQVKQKPQKLHEDYANTVLLIWLLIEPHKRMRPDKNKREREREVRKPDPGFYAHKCTSNNKSVHNTNKGVEC